MLAIIGGTGLTKLGLLEVSESRWYDTPFGEPSGQVVFGTIAGREVLFLARHGDPHQLPPHKVNYRANLFALREAGASKLIAVNAVGGIHADFVPASIAIPDQIIDYTYGREHTIFDGSHARLEHIDFTYPYSSELREALIQAAKEISLPCLETGTYGATQGPRLETAAEIQRYKRDGCDMIGMTGMPEASLARELGLHYACLALSVNWCAGLSAEVITMDDINKALGEGMGKVMALLSAVVPQV